MSFIELSLEVDGKDVGDASTNRTGDDSQSRGWHAKRMANRSTQAHRMESLRMARSPKRRLGGHGVCIECLGLEHQPCKTRLGTPTWTKRLIDFTGATHSTGRRLVGDRSL